MDPQDFGIDYCGPYVSGGKFQSSVCSTHTARSGEEQCCKDHDCCYVHAETPSDFTSCDVGFSNCNSELNSLQSTINSGLVNTFGKYFHSNKMKRPRSISLDTYDTSPVLPQYGAPNFWDDMVLHDSIYGTRPFAVGVTPPRAGWRATRHAPQAPRRSKRRLNLSSSDANSLRRNLNYTFDAHVNPSIIGKRRRFSRLPRFYRRRIANNAQRRWRIAFAKKRRANWRNKFYARKVSSASRIQRSFRKFLFRKKLRRNSFKRLRFVGTKSGLSHYYKY